MLNKCMARKGPLIGETGDMYYSMIFIQFYINAPYTKA